MSHLLLTIYIDLDHTLLDTEKLKHAFVRALKPFGISKRQFFDVYGRLRTRGSFAIGPFVELLALSPPIQKQALRALEKETGRTQRFLYKDAFPFLRYMQRKKARVALFTYGDPGFQRLKLRGLKKLTALVNKVIITAEENKTIPLPRITGKSVMIDNRPEVVDYYVKRYGMMPIVLDRKGGKGGHHYHSLTEVAKMLERDALK